MTEIKIEKGVPFIKIDKDIPVPEMRIHGGKWINTVRKMEIGDSFFCAYPNGDKARVSCYQAAKRLKIGITSRYEYGVDQMRGVRIWRSK